MTFEEYLKTSVDAGANDFRLVPVLVSDGPVKFYIHPMGVNGTTPSYLVEGNLLTEIDNAMSAELKVKVPEAA